MDLLDPLLLIPACRVLLDPLDHRDPPAHLALKATEAHLDPRANVASPVPLDLRHKPLALALFIYDGDGPPVLARLEHSWSMKEELGGLVVVKGEEATTFVCHIIQNIQTTSQDIKVDLTFVELNIKFTVVNLFIPWMTTTYHAQSVTLQHEGQC